MSADVAKLAADDRTGPQYTARSALADDRPVYPLTISARTCLDAIGMSWAWCRRFAAANGVPCWRVGDRKHLIPTAPLLAAMARASAAVVPDRELTEDERLAALRAELGLELRPASDVGSIGGGA